MSAKTKVTIFSAASVLLPLVAFANLNGICGVADLVSMLVNVFAFLVFVLAIAAILYSGFLFLTSGGNEAKVEAGRSALIWGLIGIAVALFSYYAIDFVLQIVGGQDYANCSWTPIR